MDALLYSVSNIEKFLDEFVFATIKDGALLYSNGMKLWTAGIYYTITSS